MRFQGRRESLSAAMNWASRVTSIAMEMALPPLLGSWLDRRWGTGYALLIVGAVFGFVLGMTHLLRLAADASPKKPPPQRRTSSQGGPREADRPDDQSPSGK